MAERPLTALVLAGEAPAGEVAAGLRIVGGIPLLERQVRQALKAGIPRVLLLAPHLPEPLATRVTADPRVERVRSGAAAGQSLATDSGDVLVIGPGLLLDERLVPAMAVDPRTPLLLAFGTEAPAGADRLDRDSHWAGIARLPAADAAAILADLGEWEPAATLVRAAVEAGAEHRLVEAEPLYAANRRRDVPMLWMRPSSATDARAGEEALLAAAQKGCLDWPARYLHPRIENALVRLLVDTPVTPNAVTVFTGLLGIAAIVAFATGWLWTGLLLVLAIGPLDGVDGKLARTRHEYSKWGDLEHVLDKLMEYGWFLALGSWFAREHGLAAWLVAGGIIIFALSEAAKGEWFRRFSGRQIDDWGDFERRFRLVAGRRNTFFWSLLPFAAFGLWWEGFLFLLAYAALTWAIAEWRLLKAAGEAGAAASPAIAANFQATTYDFLPKGPANG